MYKRVLLKLSGEALAGEAGSGIDPATVDYREKGRADARADCVVHTRRCGTVYTA